jgi:hypothetical protein
MDPRHNLRASSLTPRHATAKPRVVPATTRDCLPDPSEIRVGSLHVLETSNGPLQ